MKYYYRDASALVKRYVDEQRSEWIRATMDSEEDLLLFTSRMTIVEVISPFSRRVREGTLTLQDFVSARDMFRYCTLDYWAELSHYQFAHRGSLPKLIPAPNTTYVTRFGVPCGQPKRRMKFSARTVHDLTQHVLGSRLQPFPQLL